MVFDKKAWSKEYNLKNRKKLNEKLKAWRLKNPEQSKIQSKRSRLKNAGKIEEYRRKYQKRNSAKYRLTHREEILEKAHKKQIAHPEIARKNKQRWIKNNPEKAKKLRKIEHKRHYQKHKDYIVAKVKKWRLDNLEKSRAHRRKDQAKRQRSMGYICLNSWFEGSEGHHINKDYIIYIPKSLHKEFWHNHNIIESMTIINIKALEYLMRG